MAEKENRVVYGRVTDKDKMCVVGVKGLTKQEVMWVQDVMLHIELNRNMCGPNMSWPNIAQGTNGNDRNA